MSSIDSIISRLMNSIYGESMRDAIVDLAELYEPLLENALLRSQQTLTEEEKAQVRANIDTVKRSDVFLTKNTNKDIGAGLTYFSPIAYDSSNRMTPDKLPPNSYCYSVGSRLSGFENTIDSHYYYLFRLCNILNTKVSMFIIVDTNTRNVENYGFSSNVGDSGMSINWFSDIEPPIDYSVRYDQQSLTEEEKAQARENIDTVKRSDVFLTKDTSSDVAAGLTYFVPTAYSSTNRMTPDKLPPNSYCYTAGSRINGFGSTEDSHYYYLLRICNLYNTKVSMFVVIDRATKKIENLGFSSNVGDQDMIIGWSSDNQDPGIIRVKVLSIGSSFGQDCTMYTPFIVNDIAPNVELTMGVVYYSGGTISQYNNFFDNDTLLTYSKVKPGETAWTNIASTSSNAKSLKQILADEKWDIIMINQAASSGGIASSYAQINTYLNKIIGYCKSVNSHSVRLGYLMPQAALGYAPNGPMSGEKYVYADMVTCFNEIIWATTPIDFLIPAGTAIENARRTSLNSIGDGGGLTYDGNSAAGHLQEGLPVLLANYVTALKMLDQFGIKYAGIMGNTIYPDTTWVNAHAIYGINGNPTGLTDGNILLAQKCAMAAIKKPLEVTLNIT